LSAGGGGAGSASPDTRACTQNGGDDPCGCEQATRISTHTAMVGREIEIVVQTMEAGCRGNAVAKFGVP
jgi:hypothetical protein